VNPSISPRVERAVLHAIAMHPDHRQSSMAEFCTELLSSQPLDPVLVGQAPKSATREWAQAIRENSLLLVLVVVLLAIAMVVTTLSPGLFPASAFLSP
jgi:hypothetical protein